MLMGIKEIQEIIPHRHPFLLVDCIEELEPGVKAVGYKSVTYDEPYFRGHFPQEPVMPGVLIGSDRRCSDSFPGEFQGKDCIFWRLK